MVDKTGDVFLIVDEAAKVLRMARRTLDNHRWQKTGPKFRRHGGRIVYRLSDLLEWSEQRAARTAAPDKSRSPPPVHVRRHDDRPAGAGLAEGGRSNAALERQPEHSNWPIPDEIERPDEGSAGDYSPP